MHSTIRTMVIVLLVAVGGTLTCSAMKKDRLDDASPFLSIQLVYNYDVYQRPLFFLPKGKPSFGIWIREPATGYYESIFVTRKAGKNEWNFAKARPESIPVWYGVQQQEKGRGAFDLDAISGATPEGDTATIYWQIPERLRGRQLEIYLEANNSFDFNQYYGRKKGVPGYSGANGQPSVVWRATLDLARPPQQPVFPVPIGHGDLFGESHRIFPDLSRITSAMLTFHEIKIGFHQP